MKKIILALLLLATVAFPQSSVADQCLWGDTLCFDGSNLTTSKPFRTGTTGVAISAANGILTFAGLGDGADENLIVDFNTNADAVGISSSTGVAYISLNGLGLMSSGYFYVNQDDAVPFIVLNHTGEADASSQIEFRDDGVIKYALVYDMSQNGTTDFGIADKVADAYRFTIGATGVITLPIGEISLISATAGANIKAGDGTITLAGTGSGQDENLILDFNATADTVAVTSGTGVTKITASMAIASSGIVSGLIGVTPSAGSYTLGTIPEEVRGYLILLTAAGTLTLPDMAIGQSFCVMSRDDNEVVTIDAHANDSITLCPTAATCAKGVAGATVVNTVSASDGAGNYICFLVVEADNIMQVGARGTWVVP